MQLFDVAVSAFARGEIVVLLDPTQPDCPAELVFAATMVTPATLATVVRHSSGFVRVALTDDHADRLRLPLQVGAGAQEGGERYTVSCDARDGIATGISAADRARTIALLADPHTTPDRLARPGHVPVVRVHPGGVAASPRAAEAAVDLGRLAARAPSAGLAALVSPSESTRMSSVPEAIALAARQDWPVLRLDDVVRACGVPHRNRPAIGPVPLGMTAGRLLATGFAADRDGLADLVISHVDLRALAGRRVLVAVHRECLLGDVFESPLCGCAARLHSLLNHVAAEPDGILIYVRTREIQEHDTDVNSRARHILAELRVGSVTFVSTNDAQHRPQRAGAGQPR